MTAPFDDVGQFRLAIELCEWRALAAPNAEGMLTLARLIDPNWEPRFSLIVCWRSLDDHLLQVHPERPRLPISGAVTRALMVPPATVRRRIRRGHARELRDLAAAGSALAVLERVYAPLPDVPF